MDATAESTTVVREIAIAARPETVWELLVDPEQAVRWMGMTAPRRRHPTRTWEHYLERLAAVAGGTDPGADPWQSGVMD